MELKKSLLEAVEERAVGVTIPMLKPGDLIVKPVAVAHPSMVQAELDEIRWRDRFKKQCEKIADEHKDVLDYEDEARTEGNAPVIADKPVYIKDQKLTEDSHAKVAKPEGDKVKAFNNALKYAKKSGEPYCYGYTNSRLGGKFFAFDQPFKWDGDDKAFRAQYKNTGVIYIAYPDKNFIEESLVKAPSLGLDEITPFFEMCERLGIETVGDFESFMKEYGDNKDPITALKDYFKYELEDLDFRAKKESLTESVSDGWSDSLSDYDFFQDVDRLAYEIRQAYRGAYSGATTYEELADFLESTIQSELDEVIEYLRNEAEDVEPLEDEDESLDESLTEDSERDDEPSEDSADSKQDLTPIIRIDLSKFKPWGNAVAVYNQLKAADKLFDLEKLLEKEWPEGIEDAELNDLLTDVDFMQAALDVTITSEEDSE